MQNLTDFNTTITKTTTNKSYSIEIIPSKPLINGPKLSYCISLTQELLLTYSIVIPQNCDSIPLLDWYPLSESTKASIATAKKQSETSNLMSSNGVSSILSSISGVFLFGLMMIEMIYFLKYIKANFPMNAISLFENKQSQTNVFFQKNAAVPDEDYTVLPRIYSYYGVSPLFINNCGEILCQISAIFFGAMIMILINHVFTSRFKILTFLLKMVKNFFVWEMTLLFIFLSMQKFAFFIACSLQFFPFSTEGRINSVFALLVGFGVIAWFFALFKHAKTCQKFRLDRASNQMAVNTSGISSQRDSNSMRFLKPQRNDELSESPLKDLKKNKVVDEKKGESILNETNFTPTYSKKPVFNLYEMKMPILPFEGKIKTWKPKSKNEENGKKPISSDSGNKKEDKSVENIEETNQESKKISWKSPEKEKKNDYAKQEENTKEIKKGNRLKVFCLSFFVVKDSTLYLKKFGALYQDLNFKTFWQKYFKLLYYSKQILISLLVPTLYDYPVTQMMIICLIYTTFFLYTIYKSPYDSKIIFIINVVSEFICLCSILSVMAIVFMDYLEDEDYEKKLNYGWVIVFCNLALLYWVLFTGVLKVIYHMRFKYKQHKLNAAKVIPL